MPFKKEPCRNFQRGSCQYGERCKFLHVTPQMPKSNAFGFGAQSGSHQQQKPNPFGFGVQNNSQPKGANNFGNKPNQFKPFENKWTRFSPVPSGGVPSSRQPDNQPQAVNHKCTDPDSCKRVIVEDFERERPLWQLTCYSHWKNAPCDIIGDISYEELQAAAYDDAKRGLSLQSIVERERNLLNLKLVEFENLLRNPYRGPSNSVLAGQRSVPGITDNGFPLAAQNAAPTSFSSLSQFDASLNKDFGLSPSAPPNNSSGEPIFFPNSSQTSSVFGITNSPSASAGLFGSSFPAQAFGSSCTSSSDGITGAQSNQFNASAVPTKDLNSSSNQLSLRSDGSISSFNAVGGATTNDHFVSNSRRENASRDVSIWLKEKWSPGEIPEEAPPDGFV